MTQLVIQRDHTGLPIISISTEAAKQKPITLLVYGELSTGKAKDLADVLLLAVKEVK